MIKTLHFPFPLSGNILKTEYDFKALKYLSLQNLDYVFYCSLISWFEYLNTDQAIYV